jgi:translation initiation factor 2 alpha subunit (eIF-2alpha)
LKGKDHELYKAIKDKIFNGYSHLYLCFRDVAGDEVSLEKLGIERKLAQELTKAIVDKFKPAKITISGKIKLKTYNSNGVNKIKAILLEVENVSETISLLYQGAGSYKLTIEDIDYKPAERNLKKVQKILEKFNDKLSTASFERDKND